MTQSPITLDGPVRNYVVRGQRSVDGWLSALDASLIALTGIAQHERGVTGSLGEIGIHHGRLFILLGLLAAGDERCFAIDIFDRQHLNVDKSGSGDEAVFRKNLDRFGVPQSRVAVLKESSTAIGWADIQRAAGAPARIFSIDGGHTASITANDLAIAETGLAPGGVVIVDDYFNPEFPEVSEGVNAYLLGGSRLAPFVIGDNKLLLAAADDRPRYRDMLLASVPRRNFVKTSSMFGGEVLVFRTPRRLLDRLRQTETIRKITEHPLGKKLKPYVRRVLQG